MAYTYDDFAKAANEAGMMGQFSGYDLDLAKQYPEFGLSILNLKKDYAAAKTPEQRALINASANQLRGSFGNYTGGTDGSGYVTTARPGQLGSYGRESEYQAALDAVVNRPGFSWSKETDPVYGAYKKTYLREGQRAAADTLGQAAAMTGGVPSSYAVTAAQQAGNNYAAALADKVPELYDAAYQRYRQEGQDRLDLLSVLGADRQQSFDNQLAERQYKDGLSQQEKDNALALYQLTGYVPEGYESILGLPAGTPTSAAAQAAQQQERLRQQDEIDLAFMAAEKGDYSLLAKLGITPNNSNIFAAALANAGRTTPVGSGAGGSGGGGGAGGSGGAGSSGAGSGSGESGEAAGDGETAAERAVAAFNAGDRSDAVIEALLEAGYTREEIEAAGYDGTYFRGQEEADKKGENGGAVTLGQYAHDIATRLVTDFSLSRTQRVELVENALEMGWITEAEAEQLQSLLF